MKIHHADRVQILPSRPGADEIEPVDYVWALWRYRFLILACTLICGGAAWAISAAGKPVYQASAVVTMSPSGGGDVTYPVVLQVRNLLQNASVVERALARHPAATADLTPGTFIAKNLNIERNRDTNLFNVIVTLPDAAAAADTANFISDETVAAASRIAVDQQAITTSANTSAQLKQAAADAHELVVAARTAVAGFIRQSHIDDVRGQANASLRLPGDIATVEAGLQGERAALKQVLGEIASTERVIPVSGFADDTVSSERNVPGAGNRQYLNPLFATLQTRASDARARIASLEQQRVSLLADQARFTRAAASLRPLELELAALQATYDRAAAVEVDARTRAEYALKAVNPSTSTPGVRVGVTERATAPNSPIAPKPSRSLMLGLAFGAFVSVLLALALDALRVQRSDPVETVGVR
jgi:capsular polysaccharide biosynthesis protein